MKYIYSMHSIVFSGLMLGTLVLAAPVAAQTNPGIYTTTSQSTTTSSTNAATGVTTSTTNTTTNVPAGIYRAGRTSDIEARYPYDNTEGRNRSDVDAVRSGFDDPRNPWDGRYANDNPRNSTGIGANETVNRMRGDTGRNARYRPGNFGTRSLRSR